MVRQQELIASAGYGAEMVDMPQVADGRQRELRLALSMNGGVSLAVWIGGAVSEIDCMSIAVTLHPSGVATFAVSLVNNGASAYALEALRVSLPVPAQAAELLTVGGRWTNEFLQTRTPWIANCLTIENRRGHTSHERVGAVFAGTPGFAEHRGEVWAAHIGWSGNYEIVCDGVTDARRVLHLGELLAAGEVELAPGERYDMSRP